jgi:hypothetical protein
MKRFLIASMLFIAVALPSLSSAAELKIFVSEFSVSGAANKDELKGMLPGLLASRLSSDKVVVVNSPKNAVMTLSGSYTGIGKIFSLDLALKDSAGGVILRTFEQGDSPDDLIPAVGRIANKLSADLAKRETKAAAPSAQLVIPAPVAPVAAAPVKVAMPVPSSAKTVESAENVPSTDIVRAAPLTSAAAAGLLSRRIEIAMVGIAQGRVLTGGEREIFLAHERGVQFYRMKDGEMKMTSEVALKGDEKVVSIDTADLDAKGQPELYLTMTKGTKLSSRVYSTVGGKLELMADDLPYYFRAMALKGGAKKLYAQQVSQNSDYFGDVYELNKSVKGYDLKNPLPLPRFATINNFNLIAGADGKNCYVVLHPDGYLLVYSDKLEELWRSSDKYGGSEMYFVREAPENLKITDSIVRKVFWEQRIVVTGSGSIIVPQNAGFWVVGDSREYTKNAIFSFAWNGAALDERWHTKTSQNYLSDYLYDDEKKELLLLEVTKKAGFLEKGASALFLKKVE